MEDARKHEEFYTVFMRRSREGIWRADLNEPIGIDRPEDEQLGHLVKHAIVRDCNSVFAEMYGMRSPSDIIGTPLLSFMTPGDRTNVETLRLFVKSGYNVYDVETHEVDKDGNPRWFLNNAVGIVEMERLVRAYGVQREITERRLIENERHSLREKLPPRQRAIFQLIADGNSVKEVAAALNISPKTVHTHRERLMQKLKVKDIPSLLHYAVRLGLAARIHGTGELS